MRSLLFTSSRNGNRRSSATVAALTLLLVAAHLTCSVAAVSSDAAPELMTPIALAASGTDGGSSADSSGASSAAMTPTEVWETIPCSHGEEDNQAIIAQDLARSAHVLQREPGSAEERAFHAQAPQPMRFVVSSLDLDTSGKFCATVGQTVSNYKGTTVTCTSAGILTTAKKNLLLNTVIPKALARLEKVLSVTRLTSPLKVASGACSGYVQSSAQISTGVSNADFVLYVASTPIGSGVMAFSGTCQTDSSTGRPLVGRVNFDTTLLTGDTEIDLEYIVDCLTHETTHMLGFSWTTLSARGITATATKRGKTVSQITGSAVLAWARTYTGCSSLDGVELEDEGGSGTARSHYERHTYKDELMTGAAGTTLSPLSMLALQDLNVGYTVNVDQAEYMQWGRNAGCGLHNSLCNTAAGGLGTYFCGTAGTVGCEPMMDKGFGACDMGTVSTLPSYFQYFGSATYGGRGILMDACPIFNTYSNRVCNDASHAASTSEKQFGFVFAANSRCFDTSAGFILSGYSGTTNANRCFGVRCPGGTRIQFQPANGVWVDCPTSGAAGSGTIAGYSGTVTCPAAASFCTPELYVDEVTTAAPTTKAPTTLAPTTTTTKAPTTAAPTTTTTKAPTTAAPTTAAPTTAATTAAPTTKAPTASSCATCTTSEQTKFCGSCPTASPYVCTAGAAVAGCGSASSWIGSASCSSCCACPSATTTATTTTAAPTTKAPTTAAPVTTTPAPTTAAPTTAAPTTTTTKAPTTAAPTTTAATTTTTTAAPKTTSAPANVGTGAATSCGSCSSSDQSKYCGSCPTGSPFVCTAGAAVAGCGSAATAWVGSAACTACCDCSGGVATTTAAPTTTATTTTAAAPTTKAPTTTSAPATTSAPTDAPAPSDTTEPATTASLDGSSVSTASPSSSIATDLPTEFTVGPNGTTVAVGTPEQSTTPAPSSSPTSPTATSTPPAATLSPIGTSPVSGDVGAAVVSGTFKILGSAFGQLLNDAAQSGALRGTLVRDLARALGVPAGIVSVDSMALGSLIVGFTVYTNGTEYDAASVAQQVGTTTSSAAWLAETGALYASVSDETLVVSSASADVVGGSATTTAAPAADHGSLCDKRCVIIAAVAGTIAICSFLIAILVLVCRKRNRSRSRASGAKPVPSVEMHQSTEEGPAMLFSKSDEFNPEQSTEPFFDDSNAEGFIPEKSSESLGVVAETATPSSSEPH